MKVQFSDTQEELLWRWKVRKQHEDLWPRLFEKFISKAIVKRRKKTTKPTSLNEGPRVFQKKP